MDGVGMRLLLTLIFEVQLAWPANDLVIIFDVLYVA
jgi:hypothetical protein